MATRQGALQSLAEFAQSMRDEGIVTNPYCRFPLSTMQAATRHPSLSPHTLALALAPALTLTLTLTLALTLTLTLTLTLSLAPTLTPTRCAW